MRKKGPETVMGTIITRGGSDSRHSRKVTRDYYDWQRNSKQGSCQAVSSKYYDSPEQLLLSDPVRRKALELFEHEEDSPAQDYDFGELFVRILWERDWTDKLASILSRIRNRFHLRNTDTKLPDELSTLIPDMNEVKKVYDEMTNDYKQFIRSVLDAKQRWQEDQ